MIKDQLLTLGSQALQKAALNEEAKAFLLTHPTVYNTVKKAADRYIGGETLSEAVQKIQAIQAMGFELTTDYMGESIRSESEAKKATQEFVRLAEVIEKEHLSSSISLDLSHIGLLISKELAKEHLSIICLAAQKAKKEVIISMEGADRTDAILDIYKESLKNHPNLGITVQAYLYRTIDDFQDLLALNGSIRLVKGAYQASTSIAIERGPQLDETYLGYVDALFSHDHRCSIASHDETIHQEAVKLVEQHLPTHYVFERLLGINNDELKQYLLLGHPCRIYMVYGKEWYLYLCNRLAEYPLNLFRALADIVDEQYNYPKKPDHKLR